MKRFFWMGLCFIVAGCSKSTTSPPTGAECGIERWHVKILTDPDAASIDWNPVGTTVAEQNGFAPVSISEDTTRLAFEKQAVSVHCTIVEFKKEDDQDIHLILVDAAQDSMIGEIPSTTCEEVAASPHASDFNAAYKWVTDNLGTPSTDFKHVSATVTITGVIFQDFAHGQKGHAINYREVHPVTKIE